MLNWCPGLFETSQTRAAESDRNENLFVGFPREDRETIIQVLHEADRNGSSPPFRCVHGSIIIALWFVP